MPTRPARDMPHLPPVDPQTMRRLLLHEAKVHAMPGRDLRDLGDAILLHDPAEPEPFWNRLEGIRWPVGGDAFDRRLTDALVLFASLGRQPHVWAAPLYDSPVDLVARLRSNGFSDMGPGNVMALADPARVWPWPDASASWRDRRAARAAGREVRTRHGPCGGQRAGRRVRRGRGAEAVGRGRDGRVVREPVLYPLPAAPRGHPGRGGAPGHLRGSDVSVVDRYGEVGAT